MQATSSSNFTGSAPPWPPAVLSRRTPLNSGRAISSFFQSNFGPRRRASSMESSLTRWSVCCWRSFSWSWLFWPAKAGFQIGVEQVSNHPDGSGGIDDVNRRLLVIRSDFD